jgi:hypothetical protein
MLIEQSCSVSNDNVFVSSEHHVVFVLGLCKKFSNLIKDVAHTTKGMSHPVMHGAAAIQKIGGTNIP